MGGVHGLVCGWLVGWCIGECGKYSHVCTLFGRDGTGVLWASFWGMGIANVTHSIAGTRPPMRVWREQIKTDRGREHGNMHNEFRHHSNAYKL